MFYGRKPLNFGRALSNLAHFRECGKLRLICLNVLAMTVTVDSKYAKCLTQTALQGAAVWAKM